MLLNEHEKERYRKASARMQAASLPFLIYRDGEFRLSGTEDPVTDSEWLALPDKAVVGRYLFLEGNKVESHEYFLRDLDGDPPRPNTFTDRELWKKGSYNKPSDPWTAPQFTLYLVNLATNKPVEFKGTTIETRAAIGRLLDDFRECMRRPIVALRVIPKPENDKAMIPNFEIVSYSDNEEPDFPGLNIALRDDPPFLEALAKGLPEAKAKSDMDDEIPF